MMVDFDSILVKGALEIYFSKYYFKKVVMNKLMSSSVIQ